MIPMLRIVVYLAHWEQDSASLYCKDSSQDHWERNLALHRHAQAVTTVA